MRNRAVGVVKVLAAEGDLLDVVGALRAAGGFAGGLHGGQEQRDEHADDGDDDEQLDERKAQASLGMRRHETASRNNQWRDDL